MHRHFSNTLTKAWQILVFGAPTEDLSHYHVILQQHLVGHDACSNGKAVSSQAHWQRSTSRASSLVLRLQLQSQPRPVRRSDPPSSGCLLRHSWRCIHLLEVIVDPSLVYTGSPVYMTASDDVNGVHQVPGLSHTLLDFVIATQNA